jgi:hypothetical protein
MKLFITITLGLLFLQSCQSPETKLDLKKNEVIVLGTIHSAHLTEEEYNLDILRDLIINLNPDYILAEIPPDRFELAMEEFNKFDSILEPRVKRFPEYVDVIFPLTKTMNFELVPTAGWTKEMSDARSKKMSEIKADTTRIDDWNKYVSAYKLSDSLIKISKNEFNPYWINSPTYDSLVEIELAVYNSLFNTELGLGGWDNINKAHYWYINESLNSHKNEGKRFLITYGAGHKGWFLKELEKRDDINIIYLSPETD